MYVKERKKNYCINVKERNYYIKVRRKKNYCINVKKEINYCINVKRKKK